MRQQFRLPIVGLGVEVDDGSPLRSETNREGHDGALFTGERKLETKWRRMDELHRGRRMGLRNKQVQRVLAICVYVAGRGLASLAQAEAWY